MEEQKKSETLPPQFERGDVYTRFSDFYEFGGVLGIGAFGKVAHVFDKELGEQLAVKVIEKRTVSHTKLAALRKEADILRSLHHPNIVQFSHVRETQNRLFLAMELLSGGQLKKLIDSRYAERRGFSDLEASTLLRGILSGLGYIHERNLIHRDLKPENILLKNREDLSTVKIADFGLSAKFERVLHFGMDQKCGTMVYMAPEILIHQDYSKSVDQWAVGIIMYAILTGGKHPFYKDEDTVSSFTEKLRNIDHSKWDFTGISDLARSLLERLLQPNPIDRYSVAKALQHPWITRKQSDRIPKTMKEMVHSFETESTLKSHLQAVFFLSLVQARKDSGASLSTSESVPYIPENYEKLVRRVSEKVNDWHASQQICYLNEMQDDSQYPFPKKPPASLYSVSTEDDRPPQPQRVRRAYTTLSSQPVRKYSIYSTSQADTSPDSPRRIFLQGRGKSKSFKHRTSFLKQSSFRSSQSGSNPSTSPPNRNRPSAHRLIESPVHQPESCAITQEFVGLPAPAGNESPGQESAKPINLFQKQGFFQHGSRLSTIAEKQNIAPEEQKQEVTITPTATQLINQERKITEVTDTEQQQERPQPFDTPLRLPGQKKPSIGGGKSYSAVGGASPRGIGLEEALSFGESLKQELRPKRVPVFQKKRKSSSRPGSARLRELLMKQSDGLGLSPDKQRAPVLGGANFFNLKILNMAIQNKGGILGKQSLFSSKKGGPSTPLLEHGALKRPTLPSAPMNFTSVASPLTESEFNSRQSTPALKKRPKPPVAALSRTLGKQVGGRGGSASTRAKKAGGTGWERLDETTTRGTSFTLGSMPQPTQVLGPRFQNEMLFQLGNFSPGGGGGKLSLRKSINRSLFTPE